MHTYAPGTARTQVMSAGPIDEITQLRQCEALLQLGRATEALARLSVVAARDPGNPQVHALMSLALLEVGQPERAADAARRAMTLDPLREWPHRLASLAFERLESTSSRSPKPGKRSGWRLTSGAALPSWRWWRKEDLPASREKWPLPRRCDLPRASRRRTGSPAWWPPPPDAATRRASAFIAPSRSTRERSDLERTRPARRGRERPQIQHETRGRSQRFRPRGRHRPQRNGESPQPRRIIQSFFTNLSYLLFIETLVLSHWLFKDSAAWARALPVLLLAAPAVMAARFLTDLTPVLRRHVLDVCRRAPLAVPVVMGVFSALAVVASAFAPRVGRAESLVWSAFGMALTCRFSLALSLEQSIQTARNGVRQPAFSTGSLWCIAVALVLAALLLLMAATAVGAAATSRACGGDSGDRSGARLRRIRRRRRG